MHEGGLEVAMPQPCSTYLLRKGAAGLQQAWRHQPATAELQHVWRLQAATAVGEEVLFQREERRLPQPQSYTLGNAVNSTARVVRLCMVPWPLSSRQCRWRHSEVWRRRALRLTRRPCCRSCRRLALRLRRTTYAVKAGI